MSRQIRQSDLECLKADIDWLELYGNMILKDPSLERLALKRRDGRISEIFEQLKWFDNCVYEGEDALPIS